MRLLLMALALAGAVTEAPAQDTKQPTDGGKIVPQYWISSWRLPFNVQAFANKHAQDGWRLVTYLYGTCLVRKDARSDPAPTPCVEIAMEKPKS